MTAPSFRGVSLVVGAMALAPACSSSGVAPGPLGGGGNAGAGTTAGPMAGPDAMVTAFDKVPVYFTGSDNQRQVDAKVSFPATGAYQKIVMHLSLACPPLGCDPWDRLASLGVVTGRGQGGGPDTVVEVMRFITPYDV